MLTMITMTMILINDMKLNSGIYTASKQRKARTKTTLIEFLMSRNIRSLCNTTHSNERYVLITGYRRHNCTRTKYINSLGHHRFKPPFNKILVARLAGSVRNKQVGAQSINKWFELICCVTNGFDVCLLLTL